MPTGIVLASSSIGATKEAIEDVFKKHGMEPDVVEAAPPEEPVEPKRDDFESDEDFEAAQEAHEAKLEEIEAAAAEKEEKEAEEQQRKQEQRHPRMSRRERAIRKATAGLEAEVKKLREEVAAAKGGKPAAAAEPAQPKLEAPKREDFKTDEEFDDAKFDYRYKLRRAKEDAAAAASAEHNRLENNFTTYKSAIEDYKLDHEDWDKVVGTSTQLSEPLYFSIIELREDGPPVTYYLATHPEELAKINRLSHHSCAMEVARLSDRLKTGSRARKPAAGGENKPKPKPRIPEPVTPVRPAAAASTVTSAEAAKARDYRAFKAAQRAGR